MKKKTLPLIAMLLGVFLSFGLKAQMAAMTYPFKLPPSPYPLEDLEPVISKETMNYHYNFHFKTYIDNLNRLIAGTPFEQKDLETIVKESSGAVFNNAGQVLNHYIYFQTLSKHPKQNPDGRLLGAIEKEWGSVENFKQAFTAKALELFGSGWTWLAKDKTGKLYILNESNAGNPLLKGYTPLLVFDVWEHAYYIDYRNRRAEHINKIWSVIDWFIVESRY